MSLLLPPGARLVHIGPQKTGSTSVQAAMHRKRDELREHGVVYAGSGSRPRAPIWALIGTPDGSPAPPRRKWEAFCEEVADAGDARVCISNEALARVDLPLAEEVVGGLGGARAHVVAAVRSLESLLPSQWQQRVRMRRTSLSFDDWLRVVLDPERSHPEAQNVWMPHDVGPLVERWVTALGAPGRLTLVVSDRDVPDRLPRTFEELLGLPAGLLDLPEGELRNQSLGIGRTELIRQITDAVERHEWPLAPTHPLMVSLTDTVKSAAPWPDEDPLPRLPGWAAQQVAELGEQRAELVKGLGVSVVGDADALRSAGGGPGRVQGGAGDEPPVMVSAELAAAALKRALEYAVAQEAAATKLRQRVQRLRRRLDAAPANPENTPRDGLARRIARAARLRLRR